MARKTIVRHKDIIISSSLAALIIAIVVLVQIMLILPVTSAAKHYEGKSVDAVKKLEDNTRKRRQTEELEQQNARMRTQLSRFDGRVPTKGTVAALFAEVLRTAGLHKLRVLKTQPRDPVAVGQGFYKFPFVLDVVGGYHELGRFICEVESHASFMQVDDADLNAHASGPVRGHLVLILYGVNEGWLGDDASVPPSTPVVPRVPSASPGRPTSSPARASRRGSPR
jgi:Tfp pilus assembly protein PilO